MANIHPTALVDSAAELDSTVTIGPYSVVGPEVCIGQGTRIGAHCVLERNAVVGSYSRLAAVS